MEVIKVLDSKDAVLFENGFGVLLSIEFFSEYLIVKISTSDTGLKFFVIGICVTK